MEKNTFTLNNCYFSLFKAVNNALTTLKPSAGLKNVKLVFSQVSKGQNSYYKSIFSDQRRVVQILINFVSNVIKFSKINGQVTVSLKFHEI
jgi:signal transduction histidine kinase